MTEDTTTVICGAAGALGQAVCAALSKPDRTLIVVDLNAAAAEATAAAVRAIGGTAAAYSCDLTDSAAVDALRESVVASYPRIESLINLAGAVRKALVWKVTDHDFDLVYRSHVHSTLNAMRTFIPDMRAAKFGRIVNTSSVAALGTRGGAAYSAAKGAIEALTRTTALELARDGITVNAVAPGLIDVGMFQEITESVRSQMISKVPAGRAASAAEVASTYAYLTSVEAAYVTGQTINVCGGLTVGALD